MRTFRRLQAMEFAPIDLTQVAAVVMGISIILVPVIGFTARFALKPLVEALAAARGRVVSEQELRLLEERLALLERQIAQPRALSTSEVLELPMRDGPS